MLKSIIFCLIPCVSIFYFLEISLVLLFFPLFMYRMIDLTRSSLLIDKLSLRLVLLRIIIISVCTITNSNLNKVLKYLIFLNFLTFLFVLSFFSKNLLSFFLFFESSLIPLFLIILGWGYQPERLQSSSYFLFYTLFGSLPLLIIILSFRRFLNLNWIYKLINLDFIIYLGLIFAFLIKMPMFLVHLWLPKAHVEAPTIGSMILAGITLKLGSYALLRIFILSRIFSNKHNWIWIAIRLTGNLLLCIVCLRQSDLKSLIAYSSVVHMGLCLISILFAYNWSFEGRLWLSLSHGFTSSGLFYLTNSNYLRLNRRSLYINKGFINRFPLISLWWFLLLIFNMSSPPSLNLFREIKMITVISSISRLVIILRVISSFFCASYCLYLFRRMHHGKINSTQKFRCNLNITENFIIAIHLKPLLVSLFIVNFIQWNF